VDDLYIENPYRIVVHWENGEREALAWSKISQRAFRVAIALIATGLYAMVTVEDDYTKEVIIEYTKLEDEE
jgi:hypothetical protein